MPSGGTRARPAALTVAVRAGVGDGPGAVEASGARFCPRMRRRGGKRWLARIFRVRGGSSASGKWCYCAISWREGCGAGGERYALATFLTRRTAPSPARPNPQRDGRGEWNGYDDDLAHSVVHGCARVRVGEVPREPPPHRGGKGCAAAYHPGEKGSIRDYGEDVGGGGR